MHGFNKVTAVSTSGFSRGALEVAGRLGIETRTVTDASPADFASWFRVQTLAIAHQVAELDVVTIIPMATATDEEKAGLARWHAGQGQSLKLRSSKTSALVPLGEAFTGVIDAHSAFSRNIPLSPKWK
jgi:hypothetical protein